MTRYLRIGPDHPKPWTCRWCGHVNFVMHSFCGQCLNGRTQRIENMVADKTGLPRRRLVTKRSRREFGEIPFDALEVRK